MTAPTREEITEKLRQMALDMCGGAQPKRPEPGEVWILDHQEVAQAVADYVSLRRGWPSLVDCHVFIDKDGGASVQVVTEQKGEGSED